MLSPCIRQSCTHLRPHHATLPPPLSPCSCHHHPDKLTGHHGTDHLKLHGCSGLSCKQAFTRHLVPPLPPPHIPPLPSPRYFLHRGPSFTFKGAVVLFCKQAVNTLPHLLQPPSHTTWQAFAPNRGVQIGVTFKDAVVLLRKQAVMRRRDTAPHLPEASL